jgi:hypothetical protein
MRRCASFTSTNGGLGAESFKQAVVTQVGARLAASADKSNGGSICYTAALRGAFRIPGLRMR